MFLSMFSIKAKDHGIAIHKFELGFGSGKATFLEVSSATKGQNAERAKGK